MALRITFKDYLLENRLFLGRAVEAMAICCVLLIAVVARLVYLQVLHHDYYAELSLDNRVKLVPIPPTRGLIYDRNGILLAENLPSYRLEIIPEQVKDMDSTLAGLSEFIQLRDSDRQRFERLRHKMRGFESVPLRFHLTEQEVARFAVNRYRFTGVDVKAGLARHYPLGHLGVHAIGYVGRIDAQELQELEPANYRGTTHIGKVGVEKYYEKQLHGRVGYQQVETNSEGRVIRVLQRTEPVPGPNLYLHLDSRLQAVAERAMGSFHGAIVALDPRTGAVLTLVSLPNYDPNPFVNGIEVDDYRTLSTDTGRPLFNRVVRGQYPPGSTLKPFAGLAGAELGVTNLRGRTYCPGYFTLKGGERKYRDWKRDGHGSVDLIRAIVESCDVYFYDLALSMGIDRMHDSLQPFGFGQLTEIDLSGELTGLLPSRAWKRRARDEPWYTGETLISGIGQGFNLVTPIQLASVTATLATYGKRVRPHMVYAVEDTRQGTLTPQAAHYLEPVPIVAQANWDAVIDAMVQVVHGRWGTARHIGRDAPYRIAGKTGTAQVFGLKQTEKYEPDQIPKRLRDHALFIAFAPADNPRIAIAVIVENGGSGSAVAAPIARQIMDEYLLGQKS